jgi:heat-inducible transcriptional repressor
MVELEERGYIVRPHSSSGALPSDEGYRYYVRTLTTVTAPEPEERRTIRHQFHQLESELEQWARLAAAIIARTAQNVALVTLPHERESHWHRLEIVGLQASTALLQLGLREPPVRQHILSLGGPVSQESLNALAARLNSLFAGLSHRQIIHREERLEPWEERIADEALGMLAQADAAALERPYFYGLSQLLGQPEFASTDRVRRVVETLEEGRFLQPLLQEPPGGLGVRVIIGEENPDDAMWQCALVLSDYGVEATALGIIGLLGPRRMDYRRAIPTVRYLATLLTELSAGLLEQR